MKRLDAAVLMIALLLPLSLGAAQIGSVIALEGKAMATDSENKPRDLAIKSPIFLNDKVATGEGSKLQIMFNDETVISQGEKSEIVIDEYVYNPEDKENVNFSASAVKGIFRMVTGKITKLNPDRFKVKTRMATIGIRGCEIGFRISQQSENVYIIELGDRETVLIESNAKGLFDGLEQNKWGDEQTKKKLINVLHSKRAGRIVSITANDGIQEREMTPGDLARLIEDSTPVVGGDDPNLDLSGNPPDGSVADDDQAGVDDSSQPPPEDSTPPDDGSQLPSNDGTAPPEDGLPPSEDDTALLPLPPDGDQPPPPDGDGPAPPPDGDPLLPLPGDGPPPDDGTSDPLMMNDPLMPPPDDGVPPPPDGDPLVGGDPLLPPPDEPFITGDQPPLITQDPSVTGGDPLLPPPDQPLTGDDPFLTGGDPLLVSTDPLIASDPLVSGDPLISSDPLLTGTDPLVTGDQPPLPPPPPPPPPAGDQLNPPPPTTTTSGGTTTTTTTGTTDPPPPPPPPPPGPSPVFVPMGAGTDWDWGIWELEGVAQSVAFQSPVIISPANFAAIADGVAAHNLSGSGACAAIVNEAGITKLLQGGCSLNVQVGQQAAPNWNGTFSMSSPSSDNLTFDAGGLIQTDGLMTGNASTYNLMVNGRPYGIETLTGQAINGHLVGPGIGLTPITGAIGTFNFQNNGGAATVNGGFGADLF